MVVSPTSTTSRPPSGTRSPAPTNTFCEVAGIFPRSLPSCGSQRGVLYVEKHRLSTYSPAPRCGRLILRLIPRLCGVVALVALQVRIPPPFVPSKVFSVIKKRTGNAGCRARLRTIQRAARRIYQIEKHLDHAEFFRTSNFRLHQGAHIGRWLFDTDSGAGSRDSDGACRQGRARDRADRHRQDAGVPDPGNRAAAPG